MMLSTTISIGWLTPVSGWAWLLLSTGDLLALNLGTAECRLIRSGGHDDAWREAGLAGLSEVDAAWRVDAHASAGPAVYVFTKRRSACRDVELVVHEYG